MCGAGVDGRRAVLREQIFKPVRAERARRHGDTSGKG